MKNVNIEYVVWADSRCAPSQRGMALPCNDVSRWLSVSLESARYHANLISSYHCRWYVVFGWPYQEKCTKASESYLKLGSMLVHKLWLQYIAALFIFSVYTPLIVELIFYYLHNKVNKFTEGNCAHFSLADPLFHRYRNMQSMKYNTYKFSFSICVLKMLNDSLCSGIYGKISRQRAGTPPWYKAKLLLTCSVFQHTLYEKMY